MLEQRPTKYPPLIEVLLKCPHNDKMEQEKLQKTLELVKEFLCDVDAQVDDKEKDERRFYIYKKIDVKSFAMYKNLQFKKSDIIHTGRQLKYVQ